MLLRRLLIYRNFSRTYFYLFINAVTGAWVTLAERGAVYQLSSENQLFVLQNNRKLVMIMLSRNHHSAAEVNSVTVLYFEKDTLEETEGISEAACSVTSFLGLAINATEQAEILRH